MGKSFHHIPVVKSPEDSVHRKRGTCGYLCLAQNSLDSRCTPADDIRSILTLTPPRLSVLDSVRVSDRK